MVVQDFNTSTQEVETEITANSRSAWFTQEYQAI